MEIKNCKVESGNWKLDVGNRFLSAIFILILMLSFVSADYKFQNDSGTNLVRIHSENGNLSVLGNVSAQYFIGNGSQLTGLNVNPADINYWTKNGNIVYYNDGFVGVGTDSPTDKFSVYDGRINIREMTPSDYAVLEFGNDQAALRGGFFMAGSTAAGYGGPNSLNLINLGSGPVAFGTNNGVDMTIIDGGFVGIGVTNPSSILNINGGVGTLSTGLTFGDGDTGFFESLDDNLVFTRAGSNIFALGSQGFVSVNADGARISSGAATATSPTLIPSKADSTTGIGNGGAGQLSLISGGSEIVRVNSSGAFVSGDLTTSGDVCSGTACLNDIAGGNVNASNADNLDGYDSSFFMPLNKSVYGDFDFNGGWTGGGVSIIDGNVYAQSGYFYDINSLAVSTLEVNGSLVPPTGFNNQFDIGSSALRWRDGYFGTSLNVGPSSGSVKIGVDSSRGYLQYNNGIKAIDFSANSLNLLGENVTIDSSGNVGIGDTTPSSKLSINGGVGTLSTGLSFGDGDTGFYELSDDVLIVRTGAATNSVFSSTYIRGGSGNMFEIATTIQNSATSPVYTFRGDTDTGYGRQSADTLSLITGGSERMKVNNSGAFVVGDLNASGDVCAGGICLSGVGDIQGSGSGTTNTVVKFTSENQIGDSQIVDDGDQVGIGIADPISRFHVYENTAFTNSVAGITIEQAGTGDSIIQFLKPGSKRWVAGVDASDGNKFKISEDLDLNTNPRLIVDVGGNVGIGDTTPEEKLTVDGNIKSTGSIIFGSSTLTTDVNGNVQVW